MSDGGSADPSGANFRDTGWFGARVFRIGLVATSAALVLVLWWLAGSGELRGRTDLLPVSLHTLTECFAIVVASMVFAVSWHAFRPDRASNIIVLACGFLATALLDVGHMMSYQDMPAFVTPASAQKSIAFWLSARVVGTAAMLIIAFRPWRPFANPAHRYRLLAGTLAGVALVYYLQLLHPSRWPDFFLPGQGLQPVKIAIELGIVAAMSLIALRLWRSRHIASTYDVEGMLTAALMWILSEICLSLYDNVNDVYSLVGHLYKVIAYVFIYRLVFVASVREPYDRLAVEIAGKQAAEAQVEALAFHDVLSGLPNKSLLRDRVAQTLAARPAQGRSALLLLNVDGFKHINDSLGHAFGDSVLRTIAQRLPGCVSESDTVSRLGGDEFAVLLRDVQDADAAAQVAERIADALARPMQLFGRELRITVAIGVALAPDDGQSFEPLFQNAGMALHRAKEAGGHDWRFYNPAMNRDVVERLNLRNGLRLALERGDFELHYQPQLDLANGGLIGVEALVRWRHPERGLVAPMQFIPEAEEIGLIVPIGAWILQRACTQMMAWRQAGIAVPLVAVNLSATQFQRGNVEGVVLDALAQSGLPAAALELELTESTLVQDARAVLATLRRLKTLGVRLSIDDFGTGYSSLAYLRDFPIDKLKIDQGFIRELGARDDGHVIVSTIIQLARSLGLQTIAEGVEDQHTRDRLRELGCTQAQGYYYAEAMAPDALVAYLRRTGLA